VDDAYIHRRIAEHYAQTGFAWFNNGEKVMGTSSPIWTILLGLAYRIFGDHPVVVPTIEALITGLAATIAGLLALRLTQQQSANSMTLRFLGASLITWTCLLEAAVSQMETPLAITFLLAGIFLLSGTDRPGLINTRVHAGLAIMTLAVFTRLELALFLMLVALCLLLSRKLRIGTVFYACVVGVAACLWQLHQFGTLVPNTVGAKAKAYQHIPISQSLTALGLSQLAMPVFILLLCVLLWMVWDKRDLRETPLAASILLLGGLGLGILYVSRGVLVFPWYVPLVLLPFTLGLFLILPERSGKTVWALALVLILWPLRGPVWFCRHVATEALLGHRPKDGFNDAQAARVHEYLKIGGLLNSACPQATLLTSEIGGLGYSFHGRVLDGLGLVTPEAVAYHPLHFPEDSPSNIEGAIPPRYAQAAMADVIVTYQILGEATIQRAPSLGYVDFVLPPFPMEDYVPAGYYLGLMHVMVRKNGLCSAQEVKDSLQNAFGAL
jgi:hypothetical protein